MPETLLHDLLADRARERPDATALVAREGSASYAAAWRTTAAFAAGLSRTGVEPGERVAIFLEKRLEAALASFGIAAAGAVMVPVNPALKPRQVVQILADCEARTLVTSTSRLAALAERLHDAPELARAALVDGDSGSGPAALAVHEWSELVTDAAAAPEPAGASVAAEDPAAILYTSGSTGGPKGVVLSHRNLVLGAQSVNEYLGNGPDDCLLAVLPLSFDAGFSQLTTGFAAGARVVLHNYLMPADVVRACAAHGVTGMTCVPPLWQQLAAQRWPPEAAARLRYFASTGGRVPLELLGRLREAFPDAVPFLMYGLTEAFRSTYLAPEEIDRRPTSIGKAIPNAEVLVVGPDGEPCGAGEEGELVHCGPLVAQGYWNDPERTAQRFRPAPRAARHRGTAVYSGDMVRADEEGFLYFVGRDDEMIKTSGYRVSPTEIEEVAYSTGLVAAAVALGVEDERLGQRISLAVSPLDGIALDPGALERELSKDLPRYMVPSEIEVLEELPRSPNGKLDRAALRRRLEAR